jgi:hypothetical protein
MVDHAITISEELNVFGPQVANRWGFVTLGTDNWGYGARLDTKFFQNTGDSPSLSEVIGFDEAWVIKLQKVIGESFSLSGALNDINLRDGEGYYYNFPLPTVDAEDQDETAFTQVAATSTSWAAASSTSTDWDDIINPLASTSEDGA